MFEYRFLSYAKINWYLRIGDLCSDGYHNLVTVMQKVSLCDELRVSFPALKDKIICSEDIPVGQDSPLMRVLELVREIKPSLRKWGFEIRILKRIPQQSGLGGASSNVGSLLKVLNKLLRLGLGEKDLIKLAIKLGSDVPFFVTDYVFALVKGKGEKIIPLSNPPQRELVLLCPSFGISTAWAYRTWDLTLMASSKFLEGRPAWDDLSSIEDENSLFEKVHNDFEEVVFEHYPELLSYRRKLYQAGCEKVFLSGSGSTLVGVLPQESHIVRKAITEAFAEIPVCILFCKTLC